MSTSNIVLAIVSVLVAWLICILGLVINAYSVTYRTGYKGNIYKEERISRGLKRFLLFLCLVCLAGYIYIGIQAHYGMETESQTHYYMAGFFGIFIPSMTLAIFADSCDIAERVDYKE